MGKFTLIIVAIYILYYAGNIVYDLFLKKDKKITSDDATEYVIGDVSKIKDEKAKIVEIDEVETMTMPKYFSSEYTDDKETTEDNNNIEKLRNKYEEEQLFEDSEELEVEKKEEAKKVFANIWERMIDESLASVYVVDNIDGHKTYNIKTA